MKRALALAAILPLAGVATAGCKDTSDFTTREGESYCGNVVQGAFVRVGLAPDVTMRMSYDADAATTTPGRVATSDGLLRDAPMRPIAAMFHDPLSTLDFGEGRRKNYLYTADSARGGGTVTVVVSLMESGKVEVRLLRGAVGNDTTTEVFGVFPLERRRGGCGF